MTDVYDEWGIADGYFDVTGSWHDTPPSTRLALRTAIGDPVDGDPLWFVDEGSAQSLWGRCSLVLDDGTDLGEVDALSPHIPSGYHRLAPVDGGPVTTLIVAPRRCLPAPRGWGVAAQVASLWRPDGWGIGDLRDVEHLAQQVAERGGVAVLLSPLHAPAPTMPQEASPYYPSSRRWLNPLLVPVPGDAPADLGNRPGGLVDRDRVWAAKRQALGAEFHGDAVAGEWRNWARAQGTELWRFCTWNALADRYGDCWREWPVELRHPDTTHVQDLPLRDHDFAASCEFHAWLQWRAHQALRHTASAAGAHLVGDLAVGCSLDGADAWLHQDAMALGARIGAPPDAFNVAGQDWGLPPFVPWKLRAQAYAPFVAMVRATCQGMGGVRIDHVMGLFRQYWVPAGASPTEGAYVRMPADELLAIIRLEATRAGAFVVGEDLGTVEVGVHEAMDASAMLGTTVWWFDQRVSDWRVDSLATVTTHDLPTVAGVWAGSDGDEQMHAALDAACPGSSLVDAAVHLHALAAAGPATLFLASIDDLAGLDERPNYPGTTNEQHPNWCRRLPATSEAILTGDPGAAIVRAVVQARVSSARTGTIGT